MNEYNNTKTIKTDVCKVLKEESMHKMTVKYAMFYTNR